MKAPNVKLDRVYIDNKADSEKLFELVKSRPYEIEKVIGKAAIPEFMLIHYSGARFMVLKPKMPIHPSGYPAIVDLYGIDEDGDVVFFSTLVKSEDQGLGWCLNNAIPFGDDEDEEFVRQLCNETMMYFAGIQYLSLERPEVVVTSLTEVSYNKTVKKKGKYKTERRTKMIRNIRLNSKELAKRHNTITCECWGVAGHWRTYKSGKQVFIHAYRKGKKRDDPNALVPKAYSISSINERKEKNNDNP